MKPLKSEDGLEVYLCGNGHIAFDTTHYKTELSPKEALKLIAYLTKILQKWHV